MTVSLRTFAVLEEQLDLGADVEPAMEALLDACSEHRKPRVTIATSPPIQAAWTAVRSLATARSTAAGGSLGKSASSVISAGASLANRRRERSNVAASRVGTEPEEAAQSSRKTSSISRDAGGQHVENPHSKPFASNAIRTSPSSRTRTTSGACPTSAVGRHRKAVAVRTWRGTGQSLRASRSKSSST